MRSRRLRQKGVTLFVSLIMLVLMTLFALSSFRLAKGNLKIVDNMQQRNQALYAAQGAIEEVVSGTAFTRTPNVPNTTYVSINGTATNDISVVTTSRCVSITGLPVATLNFADPNDAVCLVGASQQFGISGSTVGNSSLCANAVWDIQAVATDAISQAQGIINQGTAVRVPINGTCP